MRNKTTLTPENFEAAKNQDELLRAKKEAYKAAKRGKFIAARVTKMLAKGEIEGPAKTGHFPNRYGGTHSGDTVHSIELAANAELKSQDVDATIEMFDAGGTYDSVPRVAIKEVGGVEQPRSPMYDLRMKK